MVSFLSSRKQQLILVLCAGIIGVPASAHADHAHHHHHDDSQPHHDKNHRHLEIGDLCINPVPNEADARRVTTIGNRFIESQVSPNPFESAWRWITQIFARSNIGGSGRLDLLFGSFGGYPGFLAEIPTYYHVIQPTYDEDGRVPTKQNVLDNHAALNFAFADAGFVFNLKDITFITNDKWYTAPFWKDDEIAMKTALKRGGNNVLNVYINTAAENSACGYAFFPFWLDDLPDTVPSKILDGVVNNNLCMQGGLDRYSEGDTLVHEVGHWLGLFHTFQGDCVRPGDTIDDTPYMMQNSGCPAPDERLNTCPFSPGVDPTENFMSYSLDFCKHSFTEGQITRMKALWLQFRAS